MFTENEKLNAIYGGMNPAFVRRVRERQRKAAVEKSQAEAKRAASEIAMQKERDKNALRIMRERSREQARLDKLACEESRAAAARAVEVMGAPVAVDIGLNHDMKVKEIITLIALDGNMTYDDLVGHSRVPAVVARRHMAIIEVYRLKPALSLVRIGKAFNKDHSTIIHALQKAGVKRHAGTP